LILRYVRFRITWRLAVSHGKHGDGGGGKGRGGHSDGHFLLVLGIFFFFLFFNWGNVLVKIGLWVVDTVEPSKSNGVIGLTLSFVITSDVFISGLLI